MKLPENLIKGGEIIFNNCPNGAIYGQYLGVTSINPKEEITLSDVDKKQLIELGWYLKEGIWCYNVNTEKI